MVHCLYDLTRLRPERRQWQSQRVRADAANGPVGNIRVLNTSAGVEGAPAGPACARPVPPNASLRLAAPTERLPGGRQRHPLHLALPRRRRRLRLPPLGGSDGPRGLAAAAALPRARLYGQAARWVRFASCAPLVRRPSRRRCRGRCRNRRVAHECPLLAAAPPRPRARSWSLAPPRSVAPRSPLTPSARSRPLAPPTPPPPPTFAALVFGVFRKRDIIF